MYMLMVPKVVNLLVDQEKEASSSKLKLYQLIIAPSLMISQKDGYCMKKEKPSFHPMELLYF